MDDAEEEEVCRICRSEGTEDNPLHYPCACSGSIKYVHQDCLLQWLRHSSSHTCEGGFPEVFLNVRQTQRERKSAQHASKFRPNSTRSKSYNTR
eukprot:1181802-Prorocentrum_minimum.AAC.1